MTAGPVPPEHSPASVRWNLPGGTPSRVPGGSGGRAVCAAAARPVLPLVMGPSRRGSVLGSFAQALVIGFPAEQGPRVITLLSERAAGVPNGVRLGPASDHHFDRHHPGEPVRIGGGRIQLGAVEVRVVRSFSCRVPRVHLHRDDVDTIAAAARRATRGVPAEDFEAFRRALTRWKSAPGIRILDRVTHDAVGSLVGRGLGLTPAGDDVIAGVLVGLHATGHRRLAAMVAAPALERVTMRTTLVSADLLRLAADGHACLEVLAVLRAARGLPTEADARHGTSPLPGALRRLLGIGHTSGADLATGLALGLGLGLGTGGSVDADLTVSNGPPSGAVGPRRPTADNVCGASATLAIR